MKRNLTLAVARQLDDDQEDALPIAMERGDLTRRRIGAGRLGPATPAPVKHQRWEHTLILTGTLDHRSAPELEDEVECLCEEGVTRVTLDCTRLEGIDAVGVSTIAHLDARCRSRGSRLRVSPASEVVQQGFLARGVAPPNGAVLGSVRRFERPGEWPSGRWATSMIKSL